MTDPKPKPLAEAPAAAAPVPPSSEDFIAFIRQVRRGDLVRELAESAVDAVRAVRASGKPATLSLKIKIAPDDDGDRVVLTDDITVSLPKAKKGKSLFFTTDEGKLSRTDPNQMEFKLREVAEPEVRDVK